MRSRLFTLLGWLILSPTSDLVAQEKNPQPLVILGTPDQRWKAEMYSVAISRDGAMLLFANSQEELTLVNPKTNEVIRKIAIEKASPIYRPRFTPDGSGIYLIQDNKYTLYDVKTGKKMAQLALPVPSRAAGGGLGPRLRYFPSHDGQKVAVSVEGVLHAPIRIWDVIADKSLGEIKPKQNQDNHICCWSADGSILTVSGYRHDKKDPKEEDLNEYVDFYDGKSFAHTGRIHAGERAWVIQHELSPDGKFLALYCEGLVTYQLYDVTNKKRLIEIKPEK